MSHIPLAEGVSIHCTVDDFLWPWDATTPVLMMHGFARNALFWNRWVPAVAETHRVYRPDLLGCGLSDRPPPGYRFTPETIGAQIMAVLDAFPLHRVHWVGESSGGIIGLLLAASHPERMPAWCCAIRQPESPTGSNGSMRWTRPRCPTRFAPTVSARGADKRGYRLDTGYAGKDLCDWVVSEMDRTPTEIAAAMHDCFEEVDTVPLLPRIATPVLLLSGDNSPIAAAQQQTFVERLPDGRIEPVAGVGHGVNLLQPERCARLAAQFWGSLG
jgi:3-oxoadipate enol-lactonase